MEEYETSHQEIELYCLKMNKATMICIQPNCTEPAMLCLNETCDACMNTHQKCQIYRVKVLIDEIRRKKQKITP